MAALSLHQQTWRVATETLRFTKPQVFSVWPFIKKKFAAPCLYTIGKSPDRRLYYSSLEFVIWIPINSLIYSFVNQLTFVKQLLCTWHIDEKLVRDSWRSRRQPPRNDHSNELGARREGSLEGIILRESDRSKFSSLQRWSEWWKARIQLVPFSPWQTQGCPHTRVTKSYFKERKESKGKDRKNQTKTKTFKVTHAVPGSIHLGHLKVSEILLIV